MARKFGVSGSLERLARLGVAAIALACCVTSGAAAQPQRGGQQFQAPETSQAVLRAVEAPYLTEDEAKDLRVFHGLWREGDLDTPARRARAALTAGVWDHAWLVDPEAPVLDRAEAMVRRGELEEALETLAGESSLRAVRLRAEVLELLGRFEDADAALDVAVERLLRTRADNAADLTEGVRALIARSRLRGPAREGQAGADYRTLADLLGRARGEMDRLYWPAYLAEAELLMDKDNTAQAVEAIVQALSLCPASGEAFGMLGAAAVDSFDFARAEAAARFAQERYERIDPEGELGSSPIATMVLVRARLRQGDADEAARILQPLLERFPRMREARALHAAIAAGLFEIGLTRERCATFDALSPGSPLALLEAGERLADDRQYEDAAAFLEQAAERQPNWARPRLALGLLEMQSGRDVAARDALRAATALDPFNVRARNSLTLVEELLTYERMETEHFVIRYKPGIDEALAIDMRDVLERIHARVAGSGTGGIDFEPPVRTVVEIMPDHAWFSVRITGMPSIHTVAAATGPVIAMESPQVGAGHSLGTYDWPRVLQHEYTHTVTLSRTNNRIPHWFTEAAAVYLEDAPRDFSRWRLLTEALTTGNLFGMDEIDLMFVRPRRPTDRAQAYAQGHWMYEFIIERWGANAPLRLMDLFATGTPIGPAFEQALGVESLDEFMGEFRPWAEAQAVAAGMLPSPDVPSLGELIARDRPEGTPEERTPPPSVDQLRSWLAEFPGHPEVLREIVRLTLEVNRGEATPETASLLLEYAAACPVDDGPHRALARLYLRTPGREHEAIPHLAFLDAREQATPVYAAELARQHAALGDYDAAAPKAERATWLAPFDADQRELAARIALLRQDYATAERHIAALTIIEPDREIHQRRLERVRELGAQASTP
ncbi:MAG: hypothetical protein H6809_06215 [Phycisphaeraceae bacterium]|nr:hypothetical protein [Phycisphaeraceae bacterium]